MTQAIRVKKIRVGDDVMTYCGKCKAERTHITAAMKTDTEPAEVICRTCNSKHRFRRAPGDAPKARAPREGGASDSKPRTRRAAAEPAPASGRPYSPSGSFKEGEWIEHKLYGVGSVKAVRAGKIDVSFDGTVRTLIHVG